MTRYCCPDCPDHPILNDGLVCIFCHGQYKWVKFVDVKHIKRKKK